jgi:hypothetical protein
VHYQLNSPYFAIMAAEALGCAMIFNLAGKNYMLHHFIDERGMYFLTLISNFDFSLSMGIVNEDQ